MALPQLMFRLLSYYLEGVSPDLPDGRHGTASEQNVRWLQERAGLPVTGVMDQATWNAMFQRFIREEDALEEEMAHLGQYPGYALRLGQTDRKGRG